MKLGNFQSLRHLQCALALMALISFLPRPDAIGQEQSSIQRPTLGFVFDEAFLSLRPVLGIPGAALTGSGLSFEHPVRHVEVAPGQNYGLAIDAERGSVGLVRMDLDPISVTPLAGVDPSPRRIALSPTGLSAALLYDEPQRVRVIT